MRTISDLQQLEFAIQDSRNTNTIIQIKVPDLQSALDYLRKRYDVGVIDGDVWATEGDWRLQLESK